MTKGYVIVDLKINDRARFDSDFIPAVNKSMELYEGTPIVRSDNPDMKTEHTSGGRVAVIEFPSLAHARGWYESPEYKEAHVLAGEGTISGIMVMLVEGVPTATENVAEEAAKEPAEPTQQQQQEQAPQAETTAA